MKRKIVVTFMVILVLALAAVSALAQGQEVITAVVDQNEVTTDDTVLLTITVSGLDARPELPVMNGLQVVGSSQSTQISMVNGDISSQGVYQFRLQPTQTGVLTIEPVTINVNGQLFSTQPLQIQVTQGQGPAQSVQNLGRPQDPVPAPTTLDGQDLFVESVVDNETPYQGEQIIHTFRLYQAVNLSGQPSYQPPDFKGLWNDVEPSQNSYTTEATGRTYRVSEIHHILFPTVAGELVIEPTTLVIPGGLWSRDTSLQTQPVVLDVKPLPAGAPLTFKGAVGKFEMTTAVDKQETKVGEPITLQVEISGQGNISNLGDPAWPDDPNWRSFESDSGTYTEVVDGHLHGRKSYERLLVPTNGGQLTLPGIAYSYFDPESNSYQTLTSDPLPVQVDGTAVNYSPEQPPLGDDQPADISLRPLKVVTAVQDNGVPLVQRPWYWLLWLVPLSLVIGQIANKKRQAHLAATADERRRSKAAHKAESALKKARRSQDPFAEAEKILTTYIEEKLNTSMRGLARDGRSALLKENGVSPRTIANVEICLAQAEMGRYSPAGTETKNAAELLQQTRRVIQKLEKYL